VVGISTIRYVTWECLDTSAHAGRRLRRRIPPLFAAPRRPPRRGGLRINVPGRCGVSPLRGGAEDRRRRAGAWGGDFPPLWLFDDRVVRSAGGIAGICREWGADILELDSSPKICYICGVRLWGKSPPRDPLPGCSAAGVFLFGRSQIINTQID